MKTFALLVLLEEVLTSLAEAGILSQRHRISLAQMAFRCRRISPPQVLFLFPLLWKAEVVPYRPGEKRYEEEVKDCWPMVVL